MRREHGPAGDLLALLRDPAHARSMSLADWDSTLRLGRQARLLGSLYYRFADDPELAATLPPGVQGHLRAARNYAAYLRHCLTSTLEALATGLPAEVPVVLLKGAAYVAEGLPFALGRMPGDVDLLVPRQGLDAAEGALRAAGWRFQGIDAYDERYYREWSHELPPLRHPGHAVELDLHHTITPVTSRTRADDGLLFADRVPLPGSRYSVLSPEDQIIHAAIHLFQDSDLQIRLRDVVDIDGLVRRRVRDEAAWVDLGRRAERHGASWALWYALRYCRRWLDTPVPDEALPRPPQALGRACMDWVFPRACLPRLPEVPLGVDVRIADVFGVARYHWLRMPPPLLARHFLHKVWRAFPWGRSSGAGPVA